MKAYIGIAGKIIEESLINLRSECERAGIGLIWFKDKDHKPSAKDSYFDYIYTLDFENGTSVADSLPQVSHRILIVFATYEKYVSFIPIISKHFSTPSISEADIIGVTDKAEMRERFLRHDATITPSYKTVASSVDLRDFAESSAFPIMLKPAHLMKSLHVTKNNNYQELRSNYETLKKALRDTYSKEKMHDKKPAVIAEEFLRGTFHSVDAFINKKGDIKFLPIVDLEMAEVTGINDNHNYLRILPSALNRKAQNLSLKVCEKGVKALGLINSPAHIEFVLTDDGPKLIEIGARPGGYRERMYKLSYGISYTQMIVHGARGVDYRVPTSIKSYCAVFEFFPETAGKFQALRGTRGFAGLSSFSYLSIKRSRGECVGLAKDGFRAVGVGILVSKHEKTLYQDVDWVRKNVKVSLQGR